MTQAVEEQFPPENGHEICYKTFKFETKEELCISADVDPCNSSNCVIALDPTSAKVRQCMYACSPELILILLYIQACM